MIAGGRRHSWQVFPSPDEWGNLIGHALLKNSDDALVMAGQITFGNIDCFVIIWLFKAVVQVDSNFFGLFPSSVITP